MGQGTWIDWESSNARVSARRGGYGPPPWCNSLFAALVAFIGGVSAYDGYLVIRTGPSICQYEKNPIGLYLIEYNHGDPSIFLRLKAAGTILALSALCVLRRRSRRLASRVVVVLVLFQGALLFWLTNPFS